MRLEGIDGRTVFASPTDVAVWSFKPENSEIPNDYSYFVTNAGQVEPIKATEDHVSSEMQRLSNIAIQMRGAM